MGVVSWMKNKVGGNQSLQLKIDNAAAIREIENTRGYQLIIAVLKQERKWASAELEKPLSTGTTMRLRSFIAAIDVVGHFIGATLREGALAADMADKSKDPKPLSLEEYHEMIFRVE